MFFSAVLQRTIPCSEAVWRLCTCCVPSFLLPACLRPGAVTATFPLSYPRLFLCLQHPSWPGLSRVCLALSLLTHYSSSTGQQQLLDVSSSLFLSCSLSAMDRLVQSGQPPSSSPWAALGDSELSAHAAVLLRHVGRLLAVFVHVLEGREPETRETKVTTYSPF